MNFQIKLQLIRITLVTFLGNLFEPAYQQVQIPLGSILITTLKFWPIQMNTHSKRNKLHTYDDLLDALRPSLKGYNIT
jgi:hypothetical protein